MIRDLEQGFHFVKIFRERISRWGRYNDNPYNRFELVYSNRIYIKPEYFVDIVINRFGKAFIDEQVMQPRYYDNKTSDDDDWDASDNNTTNTDPNMTNESDANGYNDAMPMSDESFDKFKLSLRNEGFDETRVTIAKQVISQNLFTSKQVKETLQQFAFEASKLEIAKFAYQYTVDKGSYFLVNDAFTYSSSKQELAEFIQSQKQ